MIDPGLPADEPERLAELRSLAILDTPGEAAFDNLTQLAASAAASPHTVRRAREAGFIDYVTKPFEIQTFVARVGQILEHRSSDD